MNVNSLEDKIVLGYGITCSWVRDGDGSNLRDMLGSTSEV